MQVVSVIQDGQFSNVHKNTYSKKLFMNRKSTHTQKNYTVTIGIKFFGFF